MEIQEFARTVLFGTTIEDKLLRPGKLEDDLPRYKGDLPAFPGRSYEISLDHSQGGPCFPSQASLKHASSRAIAMHVFANHELMALELMALSLLRFHDAPTAFRMGIASTMLDEQRHFNAYRKRAEALGVGFGDLPLSGFFWNALKSMATPMDYVTQVGMTFEQANLDFGAHYAALFQRHEDEKSSLVMQQVHHDEIGHLAYGLHWFNAFRPGEESLWKEYKAALPAGVTPSRAKGIGFDVEGRKKAGLDDSFIEELAVFSSSKGRPSSVYLSDVKREDLPFWPPGQAFSLAELKEIGRDLAPTLIPQCLSSDIIVAAPPEGEFLRSLQSVGMGLPEFVAPEDASLHLKQLRHIEAIESFRFEETEAPLSQGLDHVNIQKGSLDRRTLVEICSRFSASSFLSPQILKEGLRISALGDTRKKKRSFHSFRWLVDQQSTVFGLVLGRPFQGLPTDNSKPALSARNRMVAWETLYERASEAGAALRASGYQGAYSMTARLGSQEDPTRCTFESLQLAPKLEGAALGYRSHLWSKRVGVWLVLSTEKLNQMGFGDPSEFMGELARRFPLLIGEHQGVPKIQSGALATTPAHDCRRLFSVLLVEKTLETIVERSGLGESLGRFF